MHEECFSADEAVVLMFLQHSLDVLDGLGLRFGGELGVVGLEVSRFEFTSNPRDPGASRGANAWVVNVELQPVVAVAERGLCEPGYHGRNSAADQRRILAALCLRDERDPSSPVGPREVLSL